MPNLFAGMAAIYIIIILVPLVAYTLAYPYIALRLRDSREEHRDPELGTKAALYLLFSAAILLILIGLTVSAIDIMEGKFQEKQAAAVQGNLNMNDMEEEFKERIQRVAWGLVLSGLMFSFTLMLIIKYGTNDSEFPAAKRLFTGGRLALCGVVTMITVTAFIVLLFQKKAGAGTERAIRSIYEIIFGVGLVWIPATIVHLVTMKLYSSQGYYLVRKAPRTRFIDGERGSRLEDDE
jgi:hypothetical protein